MASKDEQLADDLIERSVDFSRFTTTEKARVFEILKRMEEDLVELLAFSGKALSDATRAEKSRLLKQAQQAITDYYGEAQGSSESAMRGAARAEASANVKSLEAAFMGSIGAQLPPEEFFKTLVSTALIQKAPSATWWNRQAADVMFRFQNEVSYGIAQGETNGQIISRVRGNALMGVARNNAAALVQTSVATATNEARRATYEANSDVLKGIKQLSTLDTHTSTICVAYSGAAWKLDEKRTPIAPNKLPYNGGTPRHWNCRSVETVLTKTFRELGIDLDEPAPTTRSATGGPVQAPTTFAAFLERKGKAFTEELLGDGRAQLWREGKITLQQLVDQQGRPLTLAQLQAKYG